VTHPEPSAGWTLPPGTALVTQADRWSWQRRAVRALGEILDAHPDLPQVTWTIGPTGLLTGLVNSLAPAEEVRATFAAWQCVLRLEGVREAPVRDSGVTSLSGHGYHGTVRVGLTARIYGPLPDDDKGVGESAPRPDDHVHRAVGRQPPAAGERRNASATRPGRGQAGPLIPPRSQGDPRATPNL